MNDRPQDQAHNPSASNPASDLIGSMVSGLGSSWAASTEAMLAWTDTWRSLMASRGGPLGDAMLQTMSDPSAWPTALVPLLDEVRTALTLPKFADLPGLDAIALPSPMPLLNLIKVSQDYMAVGVPVWLEACRRFQDEVTALRGPDGGGASAGDLLDAWNGVLDRTLMEFNRSGDFAGAQQRLLHAAVQHRHEVRTTFEKAAKAVDLPTRTEMNDIYRRMHDLTREVHALRRELRALRKAAGKRTGDGQETSAQSGRSDADHTSNAPRVSEAQAEEPHP